MVDVGGDSRRAHHDQSAEEVESLRRRRHQRSVPDTHCPESARGWTTPEASVATITAIASITPVFLPAVAHRPAAEIAVDLFRRQAKAIAELRTMCRRGTRSFRKRSFHKPGWPPRFAGLARLVGCALTVGLAATGEGQQHLMWRHAYATDSRGIRQPIGQQKVRIRTQCRLRHTSACPTSQHTNVCTRDSFMIQFKLRRRTLLATSNDPQLLPFQYV